MADSREYPTRPLCGVGAVVRKGDTVLLIQRGHEPHRGEWTAPGGAVELGESIRDAVRREIREECGIEIEVEEVVEVFDIITHDDAGKIKYHHIVIDFAASYVSGDLRAGDDAMDARWIPLSELGKYPLDEITLREIEKTRRSPQ